MSGYVFRCWVFDVPPPLVFEVGFRRLLIVSGLGFLMWWGGSVVVVVKLKTGVCQVEKLCLSG